MIEHGFDLLARNTRKPAQEIIKTCPIFQILKECLHRDTSSSEDPRTTHSTGYALNGGTGRPIQHGIEASEKAGKGQAKMDQKCRLSAKRPSISVQPQLWDIWNKVTLVIFFFQR